MATESEITLGDIFAALEEAASERTKLVHQIDKLDDKIIDLDRSVTSRLDKTDTLLVEIAAAVFAISTHIGISAEVLEAAGRAVENRRSKAT